MTQIIRRLPVVKNYVKIPGGEIHLSYRLTVQQVVDTIPGSKVVRVSPSGRTPAMSLESTGLGHAFDLPHHDFYVELPPFDAPGGDADDWFATLRALAEAS